MGSGQFPEGRKGPFTEIEGVLGCQNNRVPEQGPLPVSEGIASREKG